MLCKPLVQVFLILGAEILVMTPYIGQDLGGFQHRFTLRIMGGASPAAIVKDMGLSSALHIYIRIRD